MSLQVIPVLPVLKQVGGHENLRLCTPISPAIETFCASFVLNPGVFSMWDLTEIHLSVFIMQNLQS